MPLQLSMLQRVPLAPAHVAVTALGGATVGLVMGTVIVNEDAAQQSLQFRVHVRRWYLPLDLRARLKVEHLARLTRCRTSCRVLMTLSCWLSSCGLLQTRFRLRP